MTSDVKIEGYSSSQLQGGGQAVGRLSCKVSLPRKTERQRESEKISSYRNKPKEMFSLSSQVDLSWGLVVWAPIRKYDKCDIFSTDTLRRCLDGHSCPATLKTLFWIASIVWWHHHTNDLIMYFWVYWKVMNNRNCVPPIHLLKLDYTACLLNV